MLFVHLKNNEQAKEIIEKLKEEDKHLEVEEFTCFISVKSETIRCWVSLLYAKGNYQIVFSTANDILSYPFEVVDTLYTC